MTYHQVYIALIVLSVVEIVFVFALGFFLVVKYIPLKRLQHSLKTKKHLRLVERTDNQPHYHKDERGFLHRCYHQSVSVLRQPGFWVGNIVSTLLGFPFEHYLYDKVYPFTIITKFLGLG